MYSFFLYLIKLCFLLLYSFGGTVIDSMSTMLVMGMADSPEYRRALHHAKSINFNHTNHGLGKVSIFELTIRCVLLHHHRTKTNRLN